MSKRFLLGCHGRGGQRIPGEPVTVDEIFRLIKEAGVFDYIDRLPQAGQEKEYLKASSWRGVPWRAPAQRPRPWRARHRIPVRA